MCVCVCMLAWVVVVVAFEFDSPQSKTKIRAWRDVTQPRADLADLTAAVTYIERDVISGTLYMHTYNACLLAYFLARQDRRLGSKRDWRLRLRARWILQYFSARLKSDKLPSEPPSEGAPDSLQTLQLPFFFFFKSPIFDFQSSQCAETDRDTIVTPASVSRRLPTHPPTHPPRSTTTTTTATASHHITVHVLALTPAADRPTPPHPTPSSTSLLPVLFHSQPHAHTSTPPLHRVSRRHKMR